MTSWDKYAGKAQRLERARVRGARTRISRTAPSSCARSGRRSRAGDVVLDLACGDGGLADFLPEQRYLGVDASEEMVAAGRERGRELVHADLNDYVAARAGAGDDDLPRDLLRARPPRALRAHRGLHGAEARLRPQPAAVPARGRARRSARGRLRPARDAAVLRAADACAARSLTLRSSESAPLARLLLRYRFTLLCCGFTPRGSFVKKR